MIIQWLVLTDRGWKEVGDEARHREFTQAFKERQAQLLNHQGAPDLFHYNYPVWWGQKFDYAVNFRAMMQRNVETGTTRPLRMQILDVNTFEEARAFLSVPHPMDLDLNAPPEAQGGRRWEGGERWSIARSSS